MGRGDFISLENMKQLIEIMRNFFKDNYDFDLQVDSELKKLMLHAMNDAESKHKALPIKEKNRMLLHVMRDVVIKKFQLGTNANPAVPPAKLGRMRDPPLSSGEDASSLGSRLERLEQLRTENKERIPRFEDVHNALDETAMNDDEFQRRLQTMQSEREQVEQSLAAPASSTAASSVPAQASSMPASSTQASIVTPSPTEGLDDSLGFYKRNTARNDEMAEERIPPTYRQQITQSVPPQTHVEERYLMINSADRNWLVDTLRYRYRVKFTNSGMPVLRVPIYENNPTVPHTMTESYKGVSNEWGFKYHGSWYGAYDDTGSKGEIIGYEEMVNLTERNAHISSDFKDVVSIRVTNLTVPTEIMNASVGITNINLQEGTPFEFAHPYVLLQIDELQNVYEGTNDAIRRSFCQLQYHRYFKTPNGRGYVILKPVQEERKVFRPTPLAGLPNMSISLIKPNGELVNDSFDGLEISDIRKDNLYVRVTTHKFFKKDDIFVGDTLIFKNIRIFSMFNDGSLVVNGETLPVQNEEYIGKFNDFINRTKGHSVLSLGDPTSGGMYNTFFVRGPLGVDHDTGLLGETEAGSEAFTIMAELGNFAARLDYSLTQLSIAEKDAYMHEYRNGQIINLSLQNTISMVLETQVPDANFGH
jgi:hypothetical protein